jgi:predicted nucleotidyltransferase
MSEEALLANKQGVHKIIKDRLQQVLARDTRVLTVLFLGSSAQDKENELSDIDVCIVAKDDAALKEILGEVGVMFKLFGNMTSYYNYSPYHFYVVYDGDTPLDVYLISASLYHIIRSGKFSPAAGYDLPEAESASNASEAMVNDLLLQAYIRNLRLLSKWKRGEYVTLLYILNSIRDDNIIPLIRLVYGVCIPHPKAVRLEDFERDVRDLFVQTYPAPTKEPTLGAIRALSELVVVIAQKAVQRFSVEKVKVHAEKAHQRIAAYE